MSGMTRDDLLALPATVDIPTAAKAIGIGRVQAYELAGKGEFPCKVLKLGSRYKVITSELLKLLGVDGNANTAAEMGATREPVVRSMNALVAQNLTRIRMSRGLTQEALGQLLEPVTGRPWSKATISALERSGEGGRAREFDADDLAALAKVLGVALAFFFLPENRPPNERWVCGPADDDSLPTMHAAELRALVLGPLPLP